jgi:hypothetical protein
MLSKLYSFDNFLLEKIDVISFVIINELKEVLQNINNPIPKSTAKFVPSMDSYMPLDELVIVVTNIYNDGEPSHKEYFHVDDPREPFFKYKDGQYYLVDLKDKLKKNRRK